MAAQQKMQASHSHAPRYYTFCTKTHGQYKSPTRSKYCQRFSQVWEFAFAEFLNPWQTINAKWIVSLLQYEPVVQVPYTQITATYHQVCLTLIRPGGGVDPPLDVSRKCFYVLRAFATFFFRVLRNFWCYFRKNWAYCYQSYATLCNRASAQNMGIFWICVQNIWKMAFCAKNPFWALKVCYLPWF